MYQVVHDALPISVDNLIGNNIAQVYGTFFGWACLFPLKFTSDAHDTLPVLFKHDSVSPEIIMDNSKEQLSSEFCKKLLEANFHQKTIKPHSPWSTATEMNIRELKRGCSQKMIKTQYPKRQWDHCAELEVRTHSCGSHDKYQLGDEVPETVIKGNTADIGTICEYGCYEWVMYNDTTWQLSEPNFAIVQYLVPDIDVGSEMTAKILSKTGKVIPRSTLHNLTMQDMHNP